MTTATAQAGARSSYPLWQRLLVPSIADVFFVVVVYVLAFRPAGAGLLNDADTGWHIRNGEHILRTWSVPHTDYFSYTMYGKPWFAWEWLYDAVVGFIHLHAGLNGVVLFSAVVIAATAALLFQLLLRLSGNVVIAAGLSFLALLAGAMHALARPHILTWLLTVLWMDVLSRFQEGRHKLLFVLPLLMVFWANVHGGFILGLVLVAILLVAEVWRCLTNADRIAPASSGSRAPIIAVVAILCSAATLVTPYGYKLHVHVYQYLSNAYFMSAIKEFMPPNFHQISPRCFELVLLLAIVVATLARGKLRPFELLTMLFAVYSALIAVRNIPIATMMLAVVIAKPLAETVAETARAAQVASWLRSASSTIAGFSAGFLRIDRQLRYHLGPAVLLVVAAAIALHGGRIGSRQVMFARFPEDHLPVKAAEALAVSELINGPFSPDSWGGYLIYRFPEMKVFVDDRHDFYGEAFVRELAKASRAEEGWDAFLEKHEVKWALVPARSAVAAALKRDNRWTLVQEDAVAVVLRRKT